MGGTCSIGSTVNRVATATTNKPADTRCESIFACWRRSSTYEVLREAGIFIAILIVGVVTTFASSAGFIATLGPQSEVRRASLWLLMAVILTLGMSLVFAGDTTWAAVVPIICLAIFQRVLQVRVRVGFNETYN